MPSSLTSEANVLPVPALLRQPKVDFDRNGQKSSLEELLRLGGFFPLARIQDRLPFSRYTLWTMAKAWRGAPSEWLVRARVKENQIIILIHLDRFSEALDAQVQAGLNVSGQRSIGARPDLEEGPEVVVLSDFLRDIQGLPTPA